MTPMTPEPTAPSKAPARAARATADAAGSTAGGVWGDESLGHRLLAVLYQHRMATTEQLHMLCGPISRQGVTRQAAQLRTLGLLDRAALPRPGRSRIWFLTPAGIDLTAGWPELAIRRRYSPVTADTATLHSAHTLTVLRTHLAFAVDAARRGDEHGPMDWLPEVTHRLPEAGEDRLGPDALMYYAANDIGGRAQLRAFVEVDRGLMASERMARKLINYARFHQLTPGHPARRTAADRLPTWQNFYPRYPRVLFVLTGTAARGFATRLQDLQAMVSGHPQVAAFAKKVPLGAARLADLEDQGASAPVWFPLHGRTEATSWMDL